MKSISYAAAPLALASMVCIASPARADVIVGSPSLPVTTVGTGYFEQGTLEFIVGPYDIILSSGAHTITGTPPTTRDFSTGNEVETFGSQFAAQVSLNGNPLGTVDLFGPTGVTVFGRGSDSDTGTYTTQISFDLTGTLDGHTIEIITNPDPTDKSSGQTTITPLSGGRYDINSFFDVFTELSLDSSSFVGPVGGGSVRVALEAPEPVSLSLLGVGLLGLVSVRQWRRRMPRV